MNSTKDRIRVDALIHLPLDDGGYLPMSVPINATPTDAPGLVAFPVVLGPLNIDLDHWQITHAATGRTVGLVHKNEDDALAFAAALAPLTDWTQITPDRSLGHTVQQLALVHGGMTWEQYLEANAE